jgi:hypothetical protein
LDSLFKYLYFFQVFLKKILLIPCKDPLCKNPLNPT